MATLACDLPDPNTGVVYYGSHRYEQWLSKEVTVMERRAGNTMTATARQEPIIGRLDEVHGQLGGCRKALESLVGCPMDAEARKPDEPSCTVARLQDLIGYIESDVREINHQINRLSEAMG